MSEREGRNPPPASSALLLGTGPAALFPEQERSVEPRDFIAKVENRTARAGIIGLGYVGLPLVLEFGRGGFLVSGFDRDAAKTRALNAGESYP